MLHTLTQKICQLTAYLRESMATQPPQNTAENKGSNPPLSVPEFLGTPQEPPPKTEQPNRPDPAFELGSNGLGQGSGTPANPPQETDRQRRRRRLAELMAER